MFTIIRTDRLAQLQQENADLKRKLDNSLILAFNAAHQIAKALNVKGLADSAIQPMLGTDAKSSVVMLETLDLTVNPGDEMLIVTIRGTVESRRFSMTNGLASDDMDLIFGMLFRSMQDDKTAPAKLSFDQVTV